MTPGILLGLGVSLWWRLLNLQPGHLSLLGVHVVWALPFAFLVMLAVLNRFDPRIEESARDLGASEVRTFFEVVMPIIWPGVLSAALFGFTLSLNEFERSVLATSQNTLPLQLWAMLTVGIIEPDLYALGIVLFEMLAGRRPFDGDRNTLMSMHVVGAVPRIADRAPKVAVPVALEGLVQQLLAKEPAARPSSDGWR